MNKNSLVLLAVIVLGFGSFIFMQSKTQGELDRVIASMRRSMTELTAQNDRDRAEIQKLRAQIDVYKTEAEALRKKIAAAPVTPAEGAAKLPAAAAPAESGKSEDAGGFMKGIAKMWKDPEMKKMMRSQQAMGIRMMYGDLAQELGLSPDEASQVMELLTDRQLAMAADGMEAFNDMSDPKKMEEMGKTIAAKREEHDQQIKAVLGEERMKKLADYERTMGDRMQMQQLQMTMSASGAPLGDKERQGLLDIMKDERLKTPPSVFDPANKDVAAQMKAVQSGEGVDAMIQSTQDFNQRVLTRARTVLSPDQMNAFESAQKQQLEMMQFGMKMGREFLKGGAKDAPPAPPAPVEAAPAQ